MNHFAKLGQEFDDRKSGGEIYDRGSEDTLQSVASRRSSKSSNYSNNSRDDDQSEFVSFNESLGWKRIVMIPYNSFWSHVLVATVILHYLCLVYGYHFTNDETKIIFYTFVGTAVLIVIESMYIIDTVLSIIYKLWKKIHNLNVHVPRPVVQLLCDVIAVIPVEYVFWAVSGSFQKKTRVNIYYILTSHSLFRIYRVFVFFTNLRNNLGYNLALMRVLEIFTFTFLISHGASACFFINYCIHKDEKCYSEAHNYAKLFSEGDMQTDFEWYITSLHILVGLFTMKPFADFVPGLITLLLFWTVVLVSCILIFGYMIGQLVSALIQELKYKFVFADRIMVMKQTFNLLKVPKKLYHNTINYYQLFWEKRSGIHQKYLHYEILPNILHRDLNLDIFGDAFKRSHLLRTTNESFLSFLSLKMKAEFFMPGDIVYMKGKAKTKMIYLVSGVLQILTNEDDESPIISFSGGTCLGEAALVLTCASKVVVRCASNCEVQVLERSDFLHVVKNYPQINKSLKLLVQGRIIKAKELIEIGKEGLKPTDVVHLKDNNEDTVKWLKRFFQSSAKMKTRRKSTVYSVLQFTEINACVHRTLAYAGMYVFTEQLELTADDVCLRTTCPWILQPKSTVLRAWDNIIVVTALVVAFLLPYYAFYVIDIPNMFSSIMFVVEFIYILDLLIQTCTAVKTKTELVAEWKDIFYFRLSQFSFIADAIAAFPLEIMAYMINSQGHRYDTILRLNKVIKLWKVERYFQEQEAKHLTKTYIIKEIKYLYYLIYAIYIFGGVFFFQSCFHDACESPGWYNTMNTKFPPGSEAGAVRNITVPTLYATALIIGNSFLNLKLVTISDMIFAILAMLFSFVFLVYIFSASAAMEILSTKSWSLFKDTYILTMKYMDEYKMDIHLKRRVSNYLDFCWSYDNATTLVSGRSPFFDLTLFLRERISGPTLVPYFERQRMFKGTDPRFLLELACSCSISVVQPNEVVFYSGEPPTHAFIIINGYCEAESHLAKKNAITIFGPHEAFNVLELCVQIPNINTVRTITACHMIKIDMGTLSVVLKKFPESDMTFSLMLKSLAQWKDTPDMKIKTNAENIFPRIRTDVRVRSWLTFRSSPLSKEKEYDYMHPFARLRFFSFIRFFLLSRTMVPNGSFIIGWEMSRGLFASLSAMLFPAAGALELVLFPWVSYLRYALDGTAYVDIYMRLHVAFYDHRGLLVSHPLSTANHYLTHGFLLDLFAVFPFEIFALEDSYTSIYYCLLFNRVLQISRVIRLFLYVHYNFKFTRYWPKLSIGLKILWLSLLLCNAIGGLFVLLRCEYTLDNRSPGKFDMGIYCEYWSYMFEDYKFSEPLSPVRVYLYNVYMVTSVITRFGVPLTKVNENRAALAAVALSIFGVFMLMHTYSRIIAVTTGVDVNTTTHQENTKSLLHLIKGKHVSSDLREEVSNYFETIWKLKKGIDAFKICNGFDMTLKEDVLLHLYGKRLLECFVFASANRSFLCNLILSGHIEIFIRGSTIFSPYERTNKIYFINSGKVDLIVSGNVKASSLTVGCMFGNMPNEVSYSHSVTVIARGHVELMVIPSKEFHKLVALHPRIHKVFNKAMEKSPSDFYLELKTDTELDRRDSVSSIRSNQSIISRHISLIASCKVLNPESKFAKIMLVLQLTASYLTFFGATYFLAYHQTSYYFLGPLYALDLVFWIRIFLNFKLAYYDEHNYLVTDPATIAMHYVSVHTRIGFIYDVVAILPIEAFGLLVPDSYSLIVIAALRSNRILTAIYILQWFWIKMEQVSVNFRLIRVGFMIVWITMLIQINALAFRIFRCLEVGCASDKDLPTLKQLVNYLRELWTASCMFIGAAQAPGELMPNSVTLITYLIFAMLGTRLLFAFAIGESCAIVESSYRSMTKYTQRVARLRKFYALHDLSPPLQKELWSYLSLLWRLYRGEQVPYLLTEAPYFLREAIKSTLYGENIKGIAMFAECHEDFLRQLVACLKQFVFFPGNYITFAGDMDDNMYFVYSGEIEFLAPASKDEDEEVKGMLFEGDAFGLIQGLYPKKKHLFNYRARTVAMVLILHRTDWESMLDSFPSVKEEVFRHGNYLDITI